jgi:hypothetical protein
VHYAGIKVAQDYPLPKPSVFLQSLTFEGAQLMQIYDHLVKGLIDQQAYKRQQKELSEKKRSLEEKLERHDQANLSYQDQGMRILELVKSARKAYDQLDLKGKREMLKILLSNFTLEGGNPKPELHFAFTSFVKVLEKRKMVETERFELSSRTDAGDLLHV